MDAYLYMEQRKSMKDGGAVFFDVCNQFISARQATEAET